MQTKTIIITSASSLLLLLIPAGVFLWTLFMALLLAHALTKPYGRPNLPTLSLSHALQTHTADIALKHTEYRPTVPSCQATRISAVPGCPQFSDAACSLMRLSGICQKNIPDNTRNT